MDVKDKGYYSMSNLIESAMKQYVDFMIVNKVHTCIPGIVNKYDPSGPTVEVQPAVRKVFSDGEELTLPVIVSVPLMFQRTKRFRMSFPVEPGDGVLILFSEKSIEEWAQSNKVSTPQNNRTFAMTDAIAIPGLFGIGAGSKIEDSKSLEIIFDDFKMVSDGKALKITTLGNIELNGNSDNMVKESVLNDILSTIMTDLNFIKVMEAAFAAQWAKDYPLLTVKVAQLKSLKNKLG